MDKNRFKINVFCQIDNSRALEGLVVQNSAGTWEALDYGTFDTLEDFVKKFGEGEDFSDIKFDPWELHITPIGSEKPIIISDDYARFSTPDSLKDNYGYALSPEHLEFYNNYLTPTLKGELNKATNLLAVFNIFSKDFEFNGDPKKIIELMQLTESSKIIPFDEVVSLTSEQYKDMSEKELFEYGKSFPLGSVWDDRGKMRKFRREDGYFIEWNYDEDGNKILSFGSRTKPLSKEISSPEL